MSRNFIVRVFASAAAMTLLSTSVTFGQQIGEPTGTEPPRQVKNGKTAVITSALADRKANAIINTAGREAHLAIGGQPRNFWPAEDAEQEGALATPQNVAFGAQDLAKEEYDIVVLNGSDSQASVGVASSFPGTAFVDIGQTRPCVTNDGRPDPSGTCAGGSQGIPSNYSYVSFAVDQAAYLAGIVAAAASPNGRIGIISGLADCAECNTYIEGFTLGARSVKPAIEVQVAYLADDDIEAGFGAETAGKIFAEAFINVYRPDVLFPLAGTATTGMLEAACDANIVAIGSEIDMAVNYPEVQSCVYSSIVKDFDRAVRDSIIDVPNGTRERERVFDLNDGGVAATEEWRQVPGLPPDLQTRIDTARQQIQAGLIDTCPTQCPTRERPETQASPGPETSPEAGAGANASGDAIGTQDDSNPDV